MTNAHHPRQRSRHLLRNLRLGPGAPPIHALPFDHHVWLYQVARFSSRFRTIRDGPARLRPLAEGPHALHVRRRGQRHPGRATHEGITGDAIVAGCSIVSKLALMLACDHPRIVRAAIVIGGNSGPQPQLEHRIAAYRAAAAAGTLADYHRGHLRYGVTQSLADSPIGQYLIEGSWSAAMRLMRRALPTSSARRWRPISPQNFPPAKPQP
jgi:pimeloyl-ACP methyl ester carboxylesterase